MAEMETLSTAIGRLTEAGYTAPFHAEGDQLVCGQCSTRFDPSTATVDEIVRFEGASDPGDQAILFALHAECSHPGIYSVAYGVAATADDTTVVLALPNHVR